MKQAVSVVLTLVIIGLGYILYQSIMEPIRFEKEKNRRYAVTINRLKDIRSSQVFFKTTYGRYTASFDTLTDFVKNGNIPVVRAIGTIPEEFIDSLKSLEKAEKLALKMGIIQRDTIRIPIRDTLFRNRYADIDSMRYIPFSGGKEFSLGTAKVNVSGLIVDVFEASALNFDILRGIDKQLIVNFNDGKAFPGLKVGSLTESNNNAGNWE